MTFIIAAFAQHKCCNYCCNTGTYMNNNSTGKIQAQDFMKAVSKLTRPKRLFLELSFREREPADSLLVPQLKASIDYWRPFLK